MTSNYEYIIIGTGPAGLTLAWYLAKYNKKVLLIEKEESIGGCHRVRRVNGLFTEHGPRIIINNYFCLLDMLKELGLNFDDLYTEYNFALNSSVNNTVLILTWKEKLSVAVEFLKFMVDENISKKITMEQFMNKYEFTEKSIEYLDDLCRLTDGGTIKTYTLYEFFQIFNQNYFYKVFQPKLPNDVGLFKYWQQKLVDKNVEIMLGTEVLSVNSADKVNNIIIKNKDKTTNLTANNYIFAIPPTPMLGIVKASSDKSMFGPLDELVKWENVSKYIVYIPVTYHWDRVVPTKKLWGFTQSDYGIVYVVMSDYMDFDDDRSKTVIVCTAKNLDRKSSFNNKTAHECNEQELIDEIFRQLKQFQTELPQPTKSILSPEMFRDGNKWNSKDTAYFYTQAGYKSNKSTYDNLYWVGTHNGNSKYSFTAMETAMGNAVALLHELVPESKQAVLIQEPTTIKGTLYVIFFVLFMGIVYLFIK